jgi:hypothetical protein
MTVYVAEVAGRAVAAFEVLDDEEAADFLADDELLEDLTILTSDGLPLWDGEAEIGFRAATEEEAAAWEEDFLSAVESGETEPEARADWLVFLVPIDEPPEDDKS